MATKSIIIIGGGIAGLAAGCYGRMNGYDTHIYEMHTQPGGLCTSWKRKNYTIDGCIHWLVGSNKGSFRKMWDELGALQGTSIVNHEIFSRYDSLDGKSFIIYTDPDRFEKHLLELAPEDAAEIKGLCKAIRTLSNYDSPLPKPAETTTLGDRLGAIAGILPVSGVFMKYGSISLETYTKKLKNPFLREGLIKAFDLPDFPMIAFLMTIGWLANKNAGYPIGGSLVFSKAIEKRYLDLGGKISYQAPVKKILVENNRAVGIQLEDGSQARADIVVSAADGHATIFDMLEGRFIDDEIRGYYETLPIFEPLIMVSLGVDQDFSKEARSFSFDLPEPLEVAGEKWTAMGVNQYGFDPTLAPQGKTLLEVMFTSNHAYWKKLAEDPERYESEKKQIAISVIERLEQRFPGISKKVEMVDVATPLTFERYTGNWQGSFEGWMITTKTMRLSQSGLKRTLPGLENFHMIGQWVEPGGGLPTAAFSARNLIQRLCVQDRKPFVTSCP